MIAADADIAGYVRGWFPSPPPARLGVAVSGGGDSVALLHILHRCFDPSEVTLLAATVDHGLRAGSAGEARGVARLAQSLGIAHETLRWTGWDGGGNLQDNARRARYRLLAGWARDNGIGEIALGHTADDQAETVLMRLARSAGVDGLSAMSGRRRVHGIELLRPLLGVPRARLRAYLRDNGIGWAEDPSNSDTRYERIRARRALEQLAPAGLTVQALAGVAHNMAQAREALEHYCHMAARDIASVVAGCVVLDRRGFDALPGEVARRLFLGALRWVGGAEYPPRRSAVSGALGVLAQGTPTTLGGCRVLLRGGDMWICREGNAVRDLRAPCDGLWDGRWRLRGGDGDATGCEVRALGHEGLRNCPDWRETGLARDVLAVTPAVWRGDDLVAAPVAGLENGWTARTVAGRDEFLDTLLSH